MTSVAAAREYVLDAGILIALQRAGHLSAIVEVSEKVTLVLLEEVYDELVRGPSNHAKAAEQARSTLAQSRVGVMSIDHRDPAAAKLAAMRSGKTSTADLGEAASIAWATERASAVFVTADAKAALRGLEELRGRAIGFFQFLAEIMDLGGMDATLAAQIADDLRPSGLASVREPLWWRDWACSCTTR
jgi:predicted nucleic acid-binding protein